MSNDKPLDLEPKNNPQEYKIWENMKRRCLSSKHKFYHRYGGRGIKVCGRWKYSFHNFIKDVGRRPSAKHKLERINNDGDYRPSNIKWATHYEQCRNKSINRWIEFRGEKLCLTDWARRLSMHPTALDKRLKNWSLTLALTKPRRNQKISEKLAFRQEA